VLRHVYKRKLEKDREGTHQSTACTMLRP
jgi:hypothetical protein